MKLLTFAGIIAVLLAAPFVAGVAQEKKEPGQQHAAAVAAPGDSSSQGLPKIDLPEFVITGKEVMSFQDFAKDDADISQVPLLGAGTLNDGKPITGTIGVLAPSADLRGKGVDGSIAAGYGSHSTPHFDGWFGASTTTASVLLQAGLKTSAGHIANAGYRHGYSSLSSRWVQSGESSFLAGSSIDGNIGVIGDSYRLYGSASPGEERTVTQFSSSMGVVFPASEGFLYQGKVGWRTTSLRDSSTARGSHITGAFKANGTVEGFDVRGVADMDWNFYQAPGSGGDPFLIHGGVSARYVFSEEWDISFGLSGYVFRGSDNASQGALFPTLDINWTLGDGIHLYGSYEPLIEKADLSTLMEQNPYLRTVAAIRHPDHAQKFTLGAVADLAQSIRSSLSLSYDRVRDYPLFSDTARIGSWDIAYRGRTAFFRVEGNIFADFGSDDRLGLTVFLQSVRNSDVKAVPYAPSSGLNATYTHRFQNGIDLKATCDITGPVSADVQDVRSLPGYALLSLEGSYFFMEQLEGMLTLENLFNSAAMRYEGYLGRTRSLQAGMRYDW